MWILDDLSDAAKRAAKNPAVKKGAQLMRKGVEKTGKALARGARIMLEQSEKMPERMEKQLEQAYNAYERNPSDENFRRMCRAYDQAESVMRFQKKNDDEDY